jgi:hypothetical protein
LPAPRGGFGAGGGAILEKLENISQFSLRPISLPRRGEFWAEGAQIKIHENINEKYSLRPICPPPKGGFGGEEVPKWKNMKIFMINIHFNRFVQPQGTGLGVGRCPNAKLQNINEKYSLLPICMSLGSKFGRRISNQYQLIEN